MSDVLDVSSLESFNAEFLTKLNETIKTALVNAGREAQDQVIASKDFNGNILRHSIRYRVERGQTVSIYTDSKYASWVEFGTKPHIIRPRRKKALFFYWAKLGRFHFAQKVNHPGTKPTLFLRKATDIAFEKMTQELDTLLPTIGDS